MKVERGKQSRRTKGRNQQIPEARLSVDHFDIRHAYLAATRESQNCWNAIVSSKPMSVHNGEQSRLSSWISEAAHAYTLFNVAVGACTTALHESLNALHPLSQRSPTSTLHPLLPGLAESFSQLLAQLRHNVTALALSFKPPITAGAAVAQLDKVQQGFGRVAACVVAASGEHIDTESVLVEEWRDGVEKIGSELVRLLKVLETATVEPTNGSSSDAKETPYLLHTAIVWDAVDRLIEDLSTTEIQAVGNRWKAQSEVTKDAWSEFKEYLTEQDEEDEGSGEGGLDLGVENDDDDLGELAEMLSGGKKLSPEERARAEAASLRSKRQLCCSCN